MKLEDVLPYLFGTGGTGAIAYASAKSSRVKNAIKSLFGVDASSSLIDTVEVLKASVAALQAVGDATADAIAFLRSELAETKEELRLARLSLRDTDALSLENTALRNRVTDLEAQVRTLQEQLAVQILHTEAPSA